MKYNFQPISRSEGDRASGSKMNTPKRHAVKEKEDGEIESESPLKKFDRSKVLDAKKIQDSLKKSKASKRPKYDSDTASSQDVTDESDSEEGVEGNFLEQLNATS